MFSSNNFNFAEESEDAPIIIGGIPINDNELLDRIMGRDIDERSSLPAELESATISRRNLYYDLIRNAAAIPSDTPSEVPLEVSTEPGDDLGSQYVPNSQLRSVITKIQNGTIDTKMFTDIDDEDLLAKIDIKRTELYNNRVNDLSLIEAKQLFIDASTLMSLLNRNIETFKTKVGTQCSNINTCGYDVHLISNGGLPTGYTGNIRSCLHTLKQKLDAESKLSDNISDTVTELRKNIDVMFFKFSRIYSGLINRVELADNLIESLNLAIKKSTNSSNKANLSLDTELDSLN